MLDLKRFAPSLLFLSVVACGGDSTTQVEDPDDDFDPPVVTVVTVSPQSLELTEGESGQFEVSAFDQNGNAMSTTGAVWSVSDASVAGVTAGSVDAVRPGTAEVRARVGSVTGSAALSVAPFEEPALLVHGDTMVGYLAPGARDSIGLQIGEDDRFQLHGSVTAGTLNAVLRQDSGETRGMLDIAGEGVWYSAVYGDDPPEYFTVELPATAGEGVHYTIGVDQIDTLPESIEQEIAAGDTIRGESIGAPNGDRDVFLIEGGTGLQARVSIRFTADWIGRSLFLVGVGTITPEVEGWITADPFSIPGESNAIYFLVPQPWGAEFSLPLEFVVEVIEGG